MLFQKINTFSKNIYTFLKTRHLLVHAMFEKGPYEKYMLFRKFIRLTKHMFFEKVYMFLKKVYMFFEKVCMFFKKYICFLKKYVCFLKKYIFFEKAYIFFVRLLLVHRTALSSDVMAFENISRRNPKEGHTGSGSRY